jgi:hypothetical protein
MCCTWAVRDKLFGGRGVFIGRGVEKFVIEHIYDVTEVNLCIILWGTCGTWICAWRWDRSLIWEGDASSSLLFDAFFSLLAKPAPGYGTPIYTRND